MKIINFPWREYRDVSLLKYGEHHTGHMFQFQIWKHALDSKHLNNTIWIVLQAFLYLYLANLLITHASNFHETYEDIEPLEEAGETYDSSAEYRRIIDISNTAAVNCFYIMDLLFCLGIGSVAYLVQDVLKVVYANRFGVKARLDILNFVAVF